MLGLEILVVLSLMSTVLVLLLLLLMLVMLFSLLFMASVVMASAMVTEGRWLRTETSLRTIKVISISIGISSISSSTYYYCCCCYCF